jgi:hypothetical protein
MTSNIKKIDANNDGRVSKEEFDQFWKMQKEKTDAKFSGASHNASTFKGTSSKSLGANVSGFAEAKSPTDPTVSKLEMLISQIEAAKTESEKEALRSELTSHLNQMEQENKAVPKSIKLPSGFGEGGGKSKGVTVSAKMQVMNANGKNVNAASAQSKMLGMSSVPVKAFQVEPSWGEVSDLSSPSASTLFQSTIMKEEMIGKAMDSINKNTQKGKQLMMLFFYYAKLAESGDMGAIYQFMKFVTYIISKDKAKQQIEMGKKLIQLQELSRKWTNKLLDVQSNTTDPDASSELMKTMTIVKSETDAIATSQKLISQMMEEFAQVVETLTNTTKGALETQGRILRTVSTFR